MYLVFFIAMLAILLITPPVRKLALLLNIVDKTDHRRNIPYLGGFAIYISFPLPILLFLKLTPQLIALLIGATSILLIGAFDDIHVLRARFKFLLPLIITIISVLLGIRTNLFSHPLYDSIFSIFWIFGILNAYNFIDGFDGLSSGTAVIVSAFIGIMAISIPISILAFTLAGSCLGFLIYNFNPAKIFMGDAGSMMIGYILAAISILAFWNTPTISSFSFIPLLLFIYPIFDIFFVTIFRISQKSPPWVGDKNHPPHRLFRLGLSHKNVVLLLYLISLSFGTISYFILRQTLYNSFLITINAYLLIFILGLFLSSSKLDEKCAE